MPAGFGGGSHGGGGGGHSSSGGSHGSGNFGSFGPGHRGIYHSSVVFINGGYHRRYYYDDDNGNEIEVPRTKNMILHSVFFFLTIFLVVAYLFSIIIYGSISSSYGGLSQIKYDYEFYSNIVVSALAHQPSGVPVGTGNKYIVRGTVEGFQKVDSSYGKYYMNYAFDAKYHFSGHTFSVYSEEQKRAIEATADNNGVIYIYIALNKSVDSLELSDTMPSSGFDHAPIDFIDFSLEDDWEYVISLKMNNQFFKIYTPIIAVVFVVSFIGCLVFSKRASAERKEFLSKYKESAKKSSSGVSGASGKKSLKCRYCGSVLQEGVTKCPNCGASGDIYD